MYRWTIIHWNHWVNICEHNVFTHIPHTPFSQELIIQNGMKVRWLVSTLQTWGHCNGLSELCCLPRPMQEEQSLKYYSSSPPTSKAQAWPLSQPLPKVAANLAATRTKLKFELWSWKERVSGIDLGAFSYGVELKMRQEIIQKNLFFFCAPPKQGTYLIYRHVVSNNNMMQLVIFRTHSEITCSIKEWNSPAECFPCFIRLVLPLSLQILFGNVTSSCFSLSFPPFAASGWVRNATRMAIFIVMILYHFMHRP